MVHHNHISVAQKGITSYQYKTLEIRRGGGGEYRPESTLMEIGRKERGGGGGTPPGSQAEAAATPPTIGAQPLCATAPWREESEKEKGKNEMKRRTRIREKRRKVG
uniref:Uncharacterized protein n=1 Tax=Oryza nivara TaxID=4536 RepID=A0A0E0HRU7_ORYNI